MDEEDGRPNALAAQAGQQGALNDAPTVSLRLIQSSSDNSQHSINFMRRRFDGANLRNHKVIANLTGLKTISPTAGGWPHPGGGGGDLHENLPGK